MPITRRPPEPLQDVEHGMRGYWAGCGCETCRHANAARAAARRKLVGMGRHSPNQLVPVTRAAQWVRYLQSQGMSYKTITSATDVSQTALARVCTGRRPDGTPAHITRATEAKLLAVQPGIQRPTARVDASLTRQRVHSLVALGYPLTWIARQIGSGQRDRFAMGTERVTIATAQAIADLCGRIGETPGPSPRARKYAKRRGWKTPGYYDDDLRLLAA